jgi:hypothetical protein
MGLEGIVSKRKDSMYRSGRSPDWLKMRNPEAPAVKRESEGDWERGGRSHAVTRSTLNAVFNAWLPFIFAVGAVAVVIWRLMEWRSREQYEKTKTLYEITISNPKLAAEAASRTEADSSRRSPNKRIGWKAWRSRCSSCRRTLRGNEGCVGRLCKGVTDLLKTSSLARDQLQSLDKPTMQFLRRSAIRAN